MRIGICDDERTWCEQAEKLIAEYAGRTGMDMTVRSFQTHEELLNFGGGNHESPDVIFMDIELGGKDGIEVAKEVNRLWKNCQIVYLTNHLFYATEVYQTQHCFFVLKEQFADKIGEVFDKVLHELEQSSAKYIFETKGKKEIAVAPADICYFERERRSTNLITTWGTYEIWDKIGELEGKLSRVDFVRCHNSYIVYIPAIRELGQDAILMENNVRIPISRSHRNEVKHAFARWALTQMS